MKEMPKRFNFAARKNIILEMFLLKNANVSVSQDCDENVRGIQRIKKDNYILRYTRSNLEYT